MFLLATGLLFVTVFVQALNIQHDDGIVGLTRKNGEGCVCHNIASTPGVNVWITGPAVLPPGGTGTYTVHMSGGTGVTGGFNVAVVRGALANETAETRIIGDELTHAVEKSFSGSQVHWTFKYNAPLTPGPDTVYSVGNSTNGDLIPNDSDTWNFGSDFVVNISPLPPNPVPAISEWGAACLVLLLLGSGAYLVVRTGRS
jgi:hypothetical protein